MPCHVCNILDVWYLPTAFGLKSEDATCESYRPLLECTTSNAFKMSDRIINVSLCMRVRSAKMLVTRIVLSFLDMFRDS